MIILAYKNRSICTRKLPNKKITDGFKSILWRGSSIKSLTSGLIQKGGRARTGRQTIFHRGGGHKRLFRSIEFGRYPLPVSLNPVISAKLLYFNVDPSSSRLHRSYAKVIRIEYDPNRTSWIFVMQSMNADAYTSIPSYFYTLATHGVSVGTILSCGPGSSIKPGNQLPIIKIPTGTLVHSVESRPFGGARLARSAGAYVKIIKNDDGLGFALLELPSGQRVRLRNLAYATVGIVSNILHSQMVLRKAGTRRWLGFRPVTRGVAKNPVDHPHGGRTKGGVCPKTPWGKLTRGVPTRSKKKPALLGRTKDARKKKK